MSEKEEYVSLEKALKELRLKEDELKRLVSEGEIRAFRDADKMKFKREDIEKLKQDTGRTIQYTNESSDTLTDDLLFDEGGDDLDLGGDVGMATAPISSEETFVDEPKSKAASKKPAPAAAPKGKTASAPAAKPAAKTGGTDAKKSTSGTGRTTSIRATSGGTGKAAIKRDPAEIHPAIVGVAIFTTLVMLFACAVWWDISTGKMSSVTQGFSDSIAKSFLGDK